MATDKHTPVLERLEREFCPPLDSSLVTAIFLDSPDDEDQARLILLQLAKDIDSNPQESEGYSNDLVDNYSDTDTEGGLKKGQGDSKSSEGILTNTDSATTASEVERALEEWSIADPVEERGDPLEGEEGQEGRGDGDDLKEDERIVQRAEEARAKAEKEEETELERSRSQGGGSTTSPRSSPPLPSAQKPQQEVSLSFLIQMFPQKQISVLRRTLSESSGDLSVTVDSILTQNYLKLQNELSASRPLGKLVNGGVRAVDSDYGTDEEGRSDHRKRKSRKKEQRMKGKQVISLTDVRKTESWAKSPVPTHGGTGPGGGGGGGGRVSNGSGYEVEATPVAPENRWIALDSTALYISQVLDIPAGHVTSTYHKLDSSLPLTLSRLIDSLEVSKPFDSIPDCDSKLIELNEVMPGNKESELKRFISASDGDLSRAVDMINLVKEIEKREGTVFRSGMLGFGQDDRKVALLTPGSTLQSTTPLPVALPSKSSTAVGWTAIGAKPSASSRPILPHTDTPTMDPTHRDPVELRAMAGTYRSKRDEAYRNAARHYQAGRSGSRSGQGERGAAYYWAEVGREWDTMARRWDMRAARALVEERRTERENVVDLHNLTVTEALTVAKESVNTWYSSSPSPAPLRIITGAGRHSVNQNPVLLPAIAKMLERDGWRFRYDVGTNGAGKRGGVVVTGAANSNTTRRLL